MNPKRFSILDSETTVGHCPMLRNLIESTFKFTYFHVSKTSYAALSTNLCHRHIKVIIMSRPNAATTS